LPFRWLALDLRRDKQGQPVCLREPAHGVKQVAEPLPVLARNAKQSAKTQKQGLARFDASA